jgi:hypothetical protein
MTYGHPGATRTAATDRREIRALECSPPSGGVA